jgi:hypothetical protein
VPKTSPNKKDEDLRDEKDKKVQHHKAHHHKAHHDRSVSEAAPKIGNHIEKLSEQRIHKNGKSKSSVGRAHTFKREQSKRKSKSRTQRASQRPDPTSMKPIDATVAEDDEYADESFTEDEEKEEEGGLEEEQEESSKDVVAFLIHVTVVTSLPRDDSNVRAAILAPLLPSASILAYGVQTRPFLKCQLASSSEPLLRVECSKPEVTLEANSGDPQLKELFVFTFVLPISAANLGSLDVTEVLTLRCEETSSSVLAEMRLSHTDLVKRSEDETLHKTLFVQRSLPTQGMLAIRRVSTTTVFDELNGQKDKTEWEEQEGERRVVVEALDRDNELTTNKDTSAEEVQEALGQTNETVKNKSKKAKQLAIEERRRSVEDHAASKQSPTRHVPLGHPREGRADDAAVFPARNANRVVDMLVEVKEKIVNVRDTSEGRSKKKGRSKKHVGKSVLGLPPTEEQLRMLEGLLLGEKDAARRQKQEPFDTKGDNTFMHLSAKAVQLEGMKFSSGKCDPWLEFAAQFGNLSRVKLYESEVQHQTLEASWKPMVLRVPMPGKEADALMELTIVVHCFDFNADGRPTPDLIGEAEITLRELVSAFQVSEEDEHARSIELHLVNKEKKKTSKTYKHSGLLFLSPFKTPPRRSGTTLRSNSPIGRHASPNGRHASPKGRHLSPKLMGRSINKIVSPMKASGRSTSPNRQSTTAHSRASTLKIPNRGASRGSSPIH